MKCGKSNNFSRVCQSVSSRAKTTTEKVRSVDNAAEGSSDSSDGEQQLMTVTSLKHRLYSLRPRSYLCIVSKR